MNKFEKLIEYVINDEDKKAQALFHKIVVEKSRNIYEGLMDNDRLGGDQVDELINNVRAEETGMREDDEEIGMEVDDGMGDEMGMEVGMGDMGDEMGMDAEIDGDMMGDAEEGELEDRVVDLEDKLDELMAEFDSIVGDDEMSDEMGGEEELGMDDGEMDMEVDAEMGADEMGMDDEEMGESRNMNFESEDFTTEDDDVEDLEETLSKELDEAVALTKVSKGIANKSEEAGINKKSINADNTGKKGALANPVNFTSTEHSNNKKISYKAGDSTTEPRQSNVKVPKTSEEAGTVKKSVIESKQPKRRGRPVGSKNKRPSNTRRRV